MHISSCANNVSYDEIQQNIERIGQEVAKRTKHNCLDNPKKAETSKLHEALYRSVLKGCVDALNETKAINFELNKLNFMGKSEVLEAIANRK